MRLTLLQAKLFHFVLAYPINIAYHIGNLRRGCDMDYKTVAGWMKEQAVDMVASDLIDSGLYADREKAEDAVKRGLHSAALRQACECVFGLIRMKLCA